MTPSTHSLCSLSQICLDPPATIPGGFEQFLESAAFQELGCTWGGGSRQLAGAGLLTALRWTPVVVQVPPPRAGGGAPAAPSRAGSFTPTAPLSFPSAPGSLFCSEQVVCPTSQRKD